jgi:hypothetical protein
VIIRRDMLDYNTMLALYLSGGCVARHEWEQPINQDSGYIFTKDDQRANDWMVVEGGSK